MRAASNSPTSAAFKNIHLQSLYQGANVGAAKAQAIEALQAGPGPKNKFLHLLMGRTADRKIVDVVTDFLTKLETVMTPAQVSNMIDELDQNNNNALQIIAENARPEKDPPRAQLALLTDWQAFLDDKANGRKSVLEIVAGYTKNDVTKAKAVLEYDN